MPLNFWQFRKVGHEQWLVQSNPLQRLFIRLFGPLGVHARIRNTRVINAIQRLELPAESKLLDAGFGHGYVTFWLARQYPQYHITALEVDPKLIDDGMEIANQRGLKNVSFIRGSATDLDQTQRYDLVFSIDVLEHIEDDTGTLRVFWKCLRPGGKLLLHLPRRHQEHWRFFSAFKDHTTPDHVRDEYTASEIRDKLTQTGFRVEYLRYGFSRWGELAFELNYLFWRWNPLRVLSAIIFHPLSIWLAYMDTRRDYEDGNSLLILASVEEAREPSYV